MMHRLFQDRHDAGNKLAQNLKDRKFINPIILAMPRGGIIIAEEIAKIIHAPIDVVISRKIGAPGQEEFGIGAISENEAPWFNPQVSGYFDFDSALIEETVQEEIHELRRRIKLYRNGIDLPDLSDKTAILVDDGLATGVTAIAAAKFLRTKNPKLLILAVPIGPKELNPELTKNFDEIICLYSPSNLRGIGLWYNDFHQIEDEEVESILEKYH